MTEAGRVFRVALLALLVLGVASCGDDAPTPVDQPASDVQPPEPPPLPDPPAWPELSKAQHAEAKRLGVPVKFENALRMRFVLVPAGRYVIRNAYAAPVAVAEAEAVRRTGAARSSTAKTEGAEAEITWGPLPVEIERAFYVQITEVTNAQYRQLHPGWRIQRVHGQFSGRARQPSPDHPATPITFAEAEEFITWLSDRDPECDYRLPTTCEWEVVCRAGTTSTFWWGEDPSVMSRYARVDGRRAGHHGPTSVGSYAPSPWGLYDILGNVKEYCDWTPGSYGVEKWGFGRIPYEGADPEYAIKGGDWEAKPADLRAEEVSDITFRDGIGHAGTGFRLVSMLPKKEGE